MSDKLNLDINEENNLGGENEIETESTITPERGGRQRSRSRSFGEKLVRQLSGRRERSAEVLQNENKDEDLDNNNDIGSDTESDSDSEFYKNPKFYKLIKKLIKENLESVQSNDSSTLVIKDQNNNNIYLGNRITFNIPKNLQSTGPMNASKVKNFLSIIRTNYRYEGPNTQSIVDYLEMINRIIADSRLSHRSYNAIIWGSLGERAKLIIGQLDLTLKPNDLLQRITEKLGNMKSCASKAQEFYAIQPEQDESLINFFDRIEASGARAGLSKQIIWQKYLSSIPISLDTILTKDLKHYITQYNEYPNNIGSFLSNSLGDSRDRYLLKAKKVATPIENNQNFLE